jgi:N-6 DNA Methylase
MTALSSDLRGVLERAVIAARDAAEDSSATALRTLAVDIDRVPEHLGDGDRRLRVALRAEARQLGGFERLVEECAYEQWHRMLFARSLAENELLIHPDYRVAVSLAECEDIARERGVGDPWVVATEFASVMLPGIFRPGDPVLQVRLAPEGQRALEDLLAGLPQDVFISEDGLGWVYQYWQTKRKKEVNDSGRKIGAADIAPVTQLFTEHYMVRFLLENTLGAWWAARHPDSPLVKEWDYLRFDEEGRPAAGSFPGWPENVAELTVMDPCCGSGHFLVTGFEMLRRMRMEAEGVTAAQAGDSVLRDNLFGLELDARCTQIAAFALALQAWKSGGYRQLPVPDVPCSGISAAGRLEDWKRLARGDERLERSLERLHALFADAADLGSLIDPLRESDGDVLAAQFDEVAPLLARALGSEAATDPSSDVFGSAAAGAARAAKLLAQRYTLIVTNPPWLGRSRHESTLRDYAERQYPRSLADLATSFIERAVALSSRGGTVAMVTPQSWLFQVTFLNVRQYLLDRYTFNFVVRLGPRAFRSVSGEVVNGGLVIITTHHPPVDNALSALNVERRRDASEKDASLRSAPLKFVTQASQRANPDSIIALVEIDSSRTLARWADCYQGTSPGDGARVVRTFWEHAGLEEPWVAFQGPPSTTQAVDGKHFIVNWDVVRNGKVGAAIRGREAWGRRGIVLAQMSGLPAAIYFGEKFSNSNPVIVPRDEADFAAVAAFCFSAELARSMQLLNPKMSVDNGYIEKVPFDRDVWRTKADMARELVDSDVSSDPSQWLFNGQPRDSDAPLQVAVGRLGGYRWPRQTGAEFPSCPALGPDELQSHADEDGIVCIPSVRGERPGPERVRALLAAAFEDEWSPAREADLLAEVGYVGKSLEQWLRDGFFEQHCQLFRQRPFVWQVWDGRKDGLSVIVNYHRLDRAMLERLTYTYVGDWIRQQRAGIETGAAGSEARLAAAAELQRKLRLILDGEPPYDIFVRWKSIEEQPLGWEPDLNDGVRVNIRPFVTAGVLRKNPNVRWGKDRGKDIESAPWYRVFSGDRINDHHLTLAEKRAAREAAAAQPA